jgi:hypothetical protein
VTDEQEFRRVVKEAMQEALDERGCACNLPPEVRAEMGHFACMAIKDVGVEAIRENHKFTSRYRKRMERIGTAVTVALLSIITGGLLKLAWDGFLKRILEGLGR